MIPQATAAKAWDGDRVAHPLTPWDTVIARTLLREVHHIEVRVVVDGQTVHLFPQQPVTVPEEVLVLRQFIEFTDAPIAWHATAEAEVIWA